MPRKNFDINKKEDDNLYCNFHNWKTSTGEFKATLTDYFKAMCCFEPRENFRVEGE